MQIKRLNTILRADPKRVVCRPFNMEEKNVRRLAGKIAALTETEQNTQYQNLKREFGNRHADLDGLLEHHYQRIEAHLPEGIVLSPAGRRLLGSYFTMEYAFQAAALFNPSIVASPDQEEDGLHFIISLRSAGEGHISSLTYLGGVFHPETGVRLKPVSRTATIPRVVKRLDEYTTELRFDPATDLSERIVFPVTDDERNGIEDVRMVYFSDVVRSCFYGTYTAYDGKKIRPKLLETEDFLTFRLHTLRGSAISDKGMALFPEKVGGRYAMISRQDGDNIRIMFSDSLMKWEASDVLLTPQMPWELTKVGNCGSPLKLKEGWLLLTHGVGPMRKYNMGAILLDLQNPARIVARLKDPLLGPTEQEREGYVPNVVYSCGGIVYQDWLLLPYAMSDSASGFAQIRIPELLAEME